MEDVQNERALLQTFQTLQVVQTIYLHPLSHHILHILPGKGAQELAQAKASLHGLFAHSIPQEAFSVHLGRFLKEQAFVVLNIGQTDQFQYEAAECFEARQLTMKIMRSLKDIGLAGARAQRLFAEVMHEVLKEHVESEYAGKWSSPSSVPQDLRDWIENQFARFIVEVLACLYDDASEKLTQISHVSVQRWQQMGISQLGALRVSELFSVIVDWGLESRGAIEDLKCYINNPGARLHVTQDFSEAVSHRLLQPGASTTKILQMYIDIIRSFTILDPRGVLLDRVARPIRRYLRERDDTVNIVVTGLLADPEDESLPPETLDELAIELERTGGLPVEEGRGTDDGELDWDDMNWMPDPVDAPPGKKVYARPARLQLTHFRIQANETHRCHWRPHQPLRHQRHVPQRIPKDPWRTSPAPRARLRQGDPSPGTAQNPLRRSLPPSLRSHAPRHPRLSPRRLRHPQPPTNQPKHFPPTPNQDPLAPLLALPEHRRLRPPTLHRRPPNPLRSQLLHPQSRAQTNLAPIPRASKNPARPSRPARARGSTPLASQRDPRLRLGRQRPTLRARRAHGHGPDRPPAHVRRPRAQRPHVLGLQARPRRIRPRHVPRARNALVRYPHRYR